MSDTDSFLARVETMRRRTLGILEDLSEKINLYNLPKLPDAVEVHRQKLIASHYTVLVVGEASRGKSSFINALIGRKKPILPTDPDVATKQVFRVTHAEKESYRLRFNDGLSLPIRSSELMKYGSQTATEQKEESQINLGQLKWIEVDVPARFLPSNISLLDTPGTGSLYAPHAQITHRFIPYADAVIFVLDSRGEMGQTEKDFIDAILKVTRHIFFIQTHIDLHNDWREVLQKNEALLKQNFKDDLDDTRVWPISNVNLMKAALTNNVAFLKLSRQQELAPALEDFLFRAAGWNLCSEALTTASYGYMEARKTLVGRLVDLTALAEQKHAELEKRTIQRQQFDVEWGIHGRAREELQLEVRRIVRTSKQSLIDLIKPEGEIKRKQRNTINALQSTAEAVKFAGTMNEQVVTEVVNKWREVREQSIHQCSLLLVLLVEHADALLLPLEEASPHLHIGPSIKLNDQLRGNFLEIPATFGSVGSAAFTVLYFASLFVPGLSGLVLGASAIAGIWGVARKLKIRREAQLKEAQEQLHYFLANLLREVDDQFLQPEPIYDDKSLVDYFFHTLTQKVAEQVEKIVEQKRAEAQQESTRLEEFKLDEQRVTAQIPELREQISAWDDLGRAIKATFVELKALEQPR